MRPQGGAYAAVGQVWPFKGVDWLTPPSLMAEEFSPWTVNMELRDGYLQRRPGTTELGTVPVKPISGDPAKVLALIEWQDGAGTTHLVAVTDGYLLKWVAGETNDWVKLKDSLGADQTWTGPDVSWVVASSTAGRWLVITGSGDSVMYWDGTATGFRALGVNLADFNTARTVEVSNSHLLLGGVKIGGTWDDDLVAWSDVDDYTEWLSGTAGDITIAGSKGGIKQLLGLGDKVMVFSEDSVASLSYVGGDLVFSSQEIFGELKLCSGHSVVARGGFHTYQSQKGFYSFDGTRLVKHASEAQNPLYREELDCSDFSSSFGWVHFHRERTFWRVPTADSQGVLYVQDFNICDYTDNRWTRWELSDEVCCMGVQTTDGVPAVLVGSLGKVLVLGADVLTDDEVAFTATWESKDFTLPQGVYLSELGRWGEVELELKGTSAVVEYSVDGGVTWAAFEDSPLTLTSSWVTYQVNCDTSARMFRVRVSSTAAVAVRWVRVWARAGGAR